MEGLKDFLSVNRRLVLAVIIAVAGLVAMQNYIKAGSDECLGIADSKETIISFETPVILKRVFVLPGQVVKKGQPLLEVVPAEVNLKLLEIQTELETLVSEQNVRETLLASLNSNGRMMDESPIRQNIQGLRNQEEELKRQKALSVRYAEEDGVVATVAFRPREHVPPFMPIVTLTPSRPDLVYGFVHEKRASDYKIGDVVEVEPISDSSRKSSGRVVSLGSRIAPFPDRFQAIPTRPTTFGREVIIRLADSNQILIGEKVRVSGAVSEWSHELGFLAAADASSTFSPSEVKSQVIAGDLDIEAGGVVYDAPENSLILASDDARKSQSPFWKLDLDQSETLKNLNMTGLKKIEDVESLARDEEGRYYAVSSLSKDKDKVVPERNLIIRFTIENDQVIVDRNLDLRTPLIQSLKSQPLLRSIEGSLDELEVESFTTYGLDAYLALKNPRMPDGSSVIVKIKNLKTQIESGDINSLSTDIYSIVRLENQKCKEPGRVTDLLKTQSTLLVLSNCRKSEKAGQVWELSDHLSTPDPSLLFALHNGRVEGLGFAEDSSSFFVTSDNGKKKGSDILKVETLKQ